MFELLFEQGSIGSIKLKNRLVMAPMGNNYGSLNEAVTGRQIDYYDQQAAGGVGLIITESCPVAAAGRHGKNRIQVFHSDAVDKLEILTGRVHKHDCRIVIQLTHGGRKCSPALIGEYPVAPSSSPMTGRDYIARTLSIKEIQDVLDGYTNAAVTAYKAGFDGIQILAASGHLVHQFLSPTSNKRTDEYGGELKNRVRFLCEIIGSIKQATDDSFPVLVKIVGKDPKNPEGTWISENEILEIAHILDEKGVGSLHFSTNYASDTEREQNELFALAKKIRSTIKAKVSVAGGIHDPELGERILLEDKADFIEMGRTLLCDPDFPKKVSAGQLSLIRPCLDCNRCRYETMQKQPIRCTVNPWLGRTESPGSKSAGVAKEKKNTGKAVVIGAGPAGLNAAIILSGKGYSGVIYEKKSMPGGLLWPAAVAPDKEQMELFTNYLLNSIKDVNFDLITNTDVTEKTIQSDDFESADIIVISNGATPFIPEWINTELDNVYLATEVLEKKLSLNGTIYVLGGGQVGCEAADFISEDKTCSVILASSSPVIAKNVIPYERTPLLMRLGEKGVKILVYASPYYFDGSVLKYTHQDKEVETDCDAVVVAKGWRPDNTLRELLEKEYGDKVFTIGDAVESRSILEALAEGLNID